MANTRDTGYLRNLVVYDGSGNITLPANLTVTGTITGYATTSYVTTQINNLINGAPGALDTLNELAAALGNDASFAATLTTSLAGKQASLSGTGFVKSTAGTISYDTSTYLTTASATSTYLPLGGGTMVQGAIINMIGNDPGNGYLTFKNVNNSSREFRLIAGRTNVSGAGFSIYDSTANATRFFISNAGDTEITGILIGTSGTFSTGLTITGNGGVTNSANKFNLDFFSGNTRFYSLGTDASTKGGYEFHTNSSNGSLDVIALGIANTGTATFSSDLVLSAANPFVFGGTAAGSVGISNIGGQSYIRVYGASHATLANVTQFVNGSSTSFTISSAGVTTFNNRINGLVGGTLYNTVGLWLQGSSSTDGIAIGGTGGGDKTIDTYGGTLRLNGTANNGLYVGGAANFNSRVNVNGAADNASYALNVYGDGTFNGTRATPAYIYAIRGGDDSKLILKAGSTAGYFSQLDVSGWNGTGTPAYISLNSGSGTGIYVKLGNNIGVGTVTPSAKLDVYAGSDTTSNTVLWGQIIRNEGNAATSGYGAGLKFKISSDGEPYKWAGIAAVAGTAYSNRTDLGLFTAATSTADATEKVRITGNGYMGIGTTSPAYKFVVSNGGAAGLEVDPVTPTIAGGVDLLFYNRSGSPAYKSASFLASQFNFSGGNIGIGTVSPVARLSIDGDYADMTGTITYSTNTKGIVINQDAGGGYGTGIWFRQTGLTAGIGSTRISNGDWATDLRFYTHPSVTSNQNTLFERMIINSEGNVGIGTSSFSEISFGSSALKIAGNRATLGLVSTGTLSTIALVASSNTGTAMHLNFENTGAFRWYSYVSGGEIFTLLGNGRLGLGVTSPDAKLHVVGPILVSNGAQTYRRAITCHGQNGTYTQIKVHFNKSSWGSVAYDIKLGSAGGSHHTAGAYYSNPGLGSHVNSINAGTGLSMTFVPGSQSGDTQGATWTFSGGTMIHPILTIDIACGNGYQVNPDDIVVLFT